MRIAKLTRLTNVFAILMIAFIAMGNVSCKAIKEAKLRKKQIAQSKTELQAILDDDGSMTLEEKQETLDRIKNLNLDDEELNDLITKVEEKIEQEREEIRKKEEEERKRQEEEERQREQEIQEETLALNEQLDKNFAGIIQASKEGDYETANTLIEETKKMFASGDSYVLIIVYQKGDVVDYDEPTTIDKYLNYLKDMKKYDKKVVEFKKNAAGKLEGIELKKQ